MVDRESTARGTMGSARTAWILWSALHGGVVLFLGCSAIVLFVVGRPLLPTEMPALDWVLPLPAVIPILIGSWFQWRFVRGRPLLKDLGTQCARTKLVDARWEAAPEAMARELDDELTKKFCGAAVLSWAPAEGGALLAGIFTMLRGFQPAFIAVLALWLLSALVGAPRATTMAAYLESRLCAAGLTAERARWVVEQAARPGS